MLLSQQKGFLEIQRNKIFSIKIHYFHHKKSNYIYRNEFILKIEFAYIIKGFSRARTWKISPEGPEETVGFLQMHI